MNSKDQFDKHLADKFRQELEAFEPDYEPGGWDTFQSNLKQVKTSNGIARRAFMACATFLLLFISLPIENFLNFSNENGSDLQTASILQNNENPNLTKEVVIKTDDQLTEISNTQNVQQSGSEEEENEQPIALFSAKPKKPGSNPKDLTLVSSGNPFKKQVSFVQQGQINSFAVISPEKNQPEQNLYLTTFSFQKKGLDLPEENFEEGLNGKKIAVKTGEANFASYFNQKWSLSLVGMGFMNYNSRTDNYKALNGGLGILINLPTQNRFQFSTGLVLQSLNSKAFPDQTQFAADKPNFELGQKVNNSNDNLNGSEVIELVTNTASLTSIEIPVNLKFNLNPKSRTQFYLLGGLSSYFYLKESYRFRSEKFEVISPSNFLAIRKVEETREYSAFNHFDPFATATLAFGIEKPAGKNTISFEPFLRMPIFKMGTETSPVNTAGLVFKYNFGIGK